MCSFGFVSSKYGDHSRILLTKPNFFHIHPHTQPKHPLTSSTQRAHTHTHTHTHTPRPTPTPSTVILIPVSSHHLFSRARHSQRANESLPGTHVGIACVQTRQGKLVHTEAARHCHTQRNMHCMDRLRPWVQRGRARNPKQGSCLRALRNRNVSHNPRLPSHRHHHASTHRIVSGKQHWRCACAGVRARLSLSAGVHAACV